MTPRQTIAMLQAGGSPTVVAFGDSLTYGWMVDRGYLDFLREMIADHYPNARPEIINSGIPGDTASGGIYRLQQDVISHGPDLVMVQFALNDAFSGCRLPAYRSAIENIIGSIRKNTGAEVMLVTSVLPTDARDRELAQQFYTQLKEIAREQSCAVALVDEHWHNSIAAGRCHEHLVQADRVHPTEAGYHLMAEAVMACLKA